VANWAVDFQPGSVRQILAFGIIASPQDADGPA